MKMLAYRNVMALLAVALTAACLWAADEQPGKPKIDRRAEDVLRQTSDFYKNARSLSTNFFFTTIVQAPGIRRENWARYDINVERPNKAELRLKDGMGVTVVSDGKSMYTYAPPLNKFTQKDAPKDLQAFFSSDEVSLINRSVGNMLFINNLFKADPYAALTEGVTDADYVGLENVEGTQMHHIKLSQLAVTQDIWIQAGNQPFVRKVSTDVSKMMADAAPQVKDAKMEMYVKFDNWKANEEIAKGAFAFMPPIDAQKVGSLFESEERSELLGKPAPAVDLDQTGGGRFSLAANKGKIVVLEFWASWCAPCAQALPQVVDVMKKYDGKGVVFMTINQSEEAEVIQAFLNKRSLNNVPVALDKDGKIAAAFGLSGIPFTAIIGKDGKVQAVHSGLAPDLKQKLAEELDTLTAGKDLVSQSF